MRSPRSCGPRAVLALRGSHGGLPLATSLSLAARGALTRSAPAPLRAFHARRTLLPPRRRYAYVSVHVFQLPHNTLPRIPLGDQRTRGFAHDHSLRRVAE